MRILKQSAESAPGWRFAAAAMAAAATMVVPSRVLGMGGETSPNNRLNLGGIGIGGQGGEDLNEMTSENIVALCDVDWDHAAHTFKKFPKAKVYQDFRKMLDRERNIDAVVVGTPDHNHAIVSRAAIKRGKHVYCEKPLTHTL
jgi:predicted dehydrogenase